MRRVVFMSMLTFAELTQSIRVKLSLMVLAGRLSVRLTVPCKSLVPETLTLLVIPTAQSLGAGPAETFKLTHMSSHALKAWTAWEVVCQVCLVCVSLVVMSPIVSISILSVVLRLLIAGQSGVTWTPALCGLPLQG